MRFFRRHTHTYQRTLPPPTESALAVLRALLVRDADRHERIEARIEALDIDRTDVTVRRWSSDNTVVAVVGHALTVTHCERSHREPPQLSRDTIARYVTVVWQCVDGSWQDLLADRPCRRCGAAVPDGDGIAVPVTVRSRQRRAMMFF